VSRVPHRCPRCWASAAQVPLVHGRTKTFDLHACKRCGGVWLGRDAADKVLADAKQDGAGQPPSLFCPCCERGLKPVLVRPPGVVVDRCPADGVWFDVRELDAICAEAAKRKGIAVPARAAAVAGAGLAATAAAGAAVALAVAESTGSNRESPGSVAVDIVTQMPETVYHGVEAVGSVMPDADAASEVAGGMAEVAGGVAEAGGGMLEGAGELAEGAVEAGSGILDVLSGLLSLFD